MEKAKYIPTDSDEAAPRGKPQEANHTEKIKSQVLGKIGKPPRLQRYCMNRKQNQSTEPSASWLTLPEVARELRVRESKIKTWIVRGELTAVNVAERQSGRPRYRIRRSDLDTFLLSRTVVPPPPPSPRRRPRPPGYIECV